MSDVLLDIALELDSFQKLLELFKREKPNVRKTALAAGAADSQKCHLSCALSGHLGRPALHIASSELRAREIFNDLSVFFPGRVFYYPVKDVIFYDADVKSAEITKRRLEVLNLLTSGGDFAAIVLSVEGLFDRLTEKAVFERFILELSVGDTVNLSRLAKNLVFMGYERADMTEGPGQFAVRGGIIDIFTSIYDNPVRLELWGDQLDSIRFVDADSQRSVDKADYIKIFPMRELVYGDAETELARSRIREDFERIYADNLKNGLADEAAALKSHVSDTLERLGGLTVFAGADKYAAYFYDAKTTLLDYLPDDTIIFYDEPQRIAEHAESRLNEFLESFKNRLEKGSALPKQADSVVLYSEILRQARRFSQVLLCTLPSGAAASRFSLDATANFTVKSSSLIPNRIDLLIEDLRFYMEQNYRVVILAGGGARAQRLTEELRDHGFSAAYSENHAGIMPERGKIVLATGSLARGFEYPLIGFALICGGDIFGSKKTRTRRTVKKGSGINNFSDLKVGDYVVHVNHGVGIYRGIEKITVDNANRDYLKISYQDGGSLFVSTTQLDSLQKYIGGTESKPKLNKLGGQDWSKAKAKVRGAVAEIASELKELYARREASRGYTYSPDTVWQQEFEETFPYEETDDQLNAIADVKRDMESGKVMDRLVCGDVGYGKTEVAIRAAFKTVMDGRQTAYLVPTTILAQQHFNTFTQRMRDFPVKIELLSRFRTDKQQRQAIAGLKNGTVDIVIGTHRLLSKDLSFKNLGLVIVDEEQRFGVTHKEKLKKLKENVNVMTLTATPIPRTLHMSLSGIRDMSVLDEPPHERQPIQTYVMEFSPEFIRDAIHRELARGGQVYFLHNRVKNIADQAVKIAKLVPEANVAYAHGQMSERELENVMMDFIAGDIDVLVCTTIIETGLDIQNVNTIIIADADYMGLAQLYQLRGRVGRSNRIAYCYLMYRKDKVLTEASEKRLQTIREFTEFGSGFKIAMRDLSMRGAGNILGAEQHGHLDAVGYEMYLKLLEEAVNEQSGNPVQTDFETVIDISVNAFIPEYYIEDVTQKLDIYRKISTIQSERDYFDVQEEIEDRFGTIPQPTQTLLEIAALKSAAHAAGASSVTQEGRSLVVLFDQNACAEVNPDKIASAVVKHSGRLLFTASKEPYLTYKTLGDAEGCIKELTGILRSLVI